MSYIETSKLKNSTIMLLFAERDRINMSPEYQRSGGVWTKQKKQLLIDSIINDYDIPKLYFHKISATDEQKIKYDYSVIDGRQRLETIFEFIDGAFPLSSDMDYQKDESINLGGLTYNDLAKKFPKIRIKFDSFVLPVVQVEVEDLDLIEDMFSRLNEAVPLNAAEKRNAIGGDLVSQIRSTSLHKFFVDKVSFANTRAQHKEISARLLLSESNLMQEGKLVDTKREFLDRLAREYKSDASEYVKVLGASVDNILDKMSDFFTDKDELLRAQGIMVIYYLIFRAANATNSLDSFTRQNLVEFREALKENRRMAEEELSESNFELLEFDRLSQQGTNDASNIRSRFKTLCDYLHIPPILDFREIG